MIFQYTLNKVFGDKMKKCVICNEKAGFFSKRITDGCICSKCIAYIPERVKLRYADTEYLTGIYNTNKEKQKKFNWTASYGSLFIDSTHGMFCISKKIKKDNPMEFGDIYFITDLLEIALYCTDVRNIGTKTNKIVCNVKMRAKTNESSNEYSIRQNERCSFTHIGNGSLECNEPEKFIMFRNMFNQMIDNVRFNLLNKLDDIQRMKKNINAFEDNREWAKGVLFLDDKNYSLETIKRHRNILIRQFHPDISSDYGTEFAEKINKAYDILTK